MSQNQIFNIDPDVLAGFVDEAIENLSGVSNSFIRLGKEGFHEEVVASVFRVFHSIKGNAAYFGLFAIKDLSHALEQILDKIRNRELLITDRVINRLIEGTSHLEESFKAIQELGAEASLDKDFTLFIDALSLLTEDEYDSERALHRVREMAFAIEKGDLKFEDLLLFIKNVTQEDSEAEKDTLTLREYSHSKPILERLVEIFSITTDAALDKDLVNEADILFLSLKEFDLSKESLEHLEDLYSDFTVCSTTVGIDPLMRELLLEKTLELGTHPYEDVAKSKVDTVIEAGEETTPSKQKDQSATLNKTMRVSEKSVDEFLSYVGELIVIEESYAQIGTQLISSSIGVSQAASLIKKTTDVFSSLSRALQKSIMAIRKVPVEMLFNRMPKIVHEVANNRGKKISVSIDSGDIRVDKTMLEILEAPLVHMVRNAADHGIESPDQRIAAGKPEVGEISLSAYDEGEFTYIIIKDDGGGINLDKLREKAISIGLISSDSTFTKEMIIDTMFSSGMSTVDEVTDISGRGVGMDVVRKNVESVGGSIYTETTKGVGTEFVIKLPIRVTTQIIQGFIVSVVGERYIFPLHFVRATLNYRDIKTTEVANRGGKFIIYKDHAIPLYNLSGLVGGDETPDGEGVVVVLSIENREYAVVASSVDGIRQVVLKPIDISVDLSDLFLGGALMGDGTVALVFNVEKVFSS